MATLTKGELLEIDDTERCAAIAHHTLSHDRVHGGRRNPCYVASEVTERRGRRQPCCREDQPKPNAAPGRDGDGEWTGDMAQLEMTRHAAESRRGHQLHTIEVPARTNR